jgi:hypothetical protein
MPDPLVPLFAPRIRVLDSETGPLRLSPTPAEDGPAPVAGGRPKGCKRLHTNATVARVRQLIEDTTLTYKQIAARTGTSAGTVGVWTRGFGWKRHPFAPRCTDTVPTARAGRRLKLRMLGHKLYELAERCVQQLWEDPLVDLDRLIEAMQALNMARLYVKGRGRPGKPGQAPSTGKEWLDRDEAMRAALKELRRGGVRLDRIPAAAMALLEDAHTPPERDHPAFKARGPRRRK